MKDIAIALLTISAVMLIFLMVLQNRRIKKLVRAMRVYKTAGKITDYSLLSNALASLQNEISDLQNRIELEKRNTQNITKNNISFISDISHQLKTPISALRLYCEMDLAKNISAHADKELLLIEKMENLIRNLLKLEKIKGDTYQMDFEMIEVKELVDKLFASFSHLFPEKHYKVSGKSSLRADKVWLSEALGNIIKNASEYTKVDGTVEINIVHSESSTVIEVQDNGGGIDESDTENLFTRSHKTKNSIPESAGIGLAITRAIIEKHHGIVTAENKKDGLCVTVCLPHIDGQIAI